MKKRVLFLISILILFLSAYSVSSESIDSSIKKITYNAEQYEIGNINYARLIVYMASLSKELAEEMGATSDSHDQILKQEQLEKALGPPTETTKWAWVENEDREKKLDSEAQAWRKIIFDGKKIQIFLNAWPSIRKIDGEDKLVYRLHTDISFKSQEDEIDLNAEIEKMKSFAESYSLDPTRANLERLAEESVNIEQAFNNNPYKNSLKCENQMDDLFGSENRRDSQNILMQEITFFEADNAEAIVRLEMCDECEWHWINMDLRLESRGRFKQPEQNNGYDQNFREKYLSYSNEDFKEETRSIISEVKSSLENKDYQSATDRMQDLRILTEAWNEKSNNVWQEIEGQFKVDFDSMTQEEREECSKTYCWIKKDQERIKAEKELKNKNHEERKQFFLSLFSDYDKKESYSSQEQWEQRLFEQFKEFGEEICSNNLDDNNNQQIDCAEQQCGGKVCGFGEVMITDENNQTTAQKRELYCIASTCQAKEEVVIANETVACGNNICEENEIETCSTDCALCIGYEALECTGTVLFSGKDANSCSLAPICLTENLVCETDNDCTDPLCGDYSCVEGTCQLSQLTECRSPECVAGEEKVQNCATGEEIVVQACLEGIWRSTGVECLASSGATETPQPQEEIVNGSEAEGTGQSEIEGVVVVEEAVGNICIVKSDCGNENDVCSNGNCVTLPEAEIIKLSDIPPEEQETSQETETGEQPQASSPGESRQETAPEQQNTNNENEEQPQITGNAVFSFFKSLITGFQVEGGEGSSSEESSGSTTGENTGENQQPPSEPQPESQPQNSPPPEENRGEEDRERENREREDRDRERREEDDQERRTQECAQRCDREFYDSKIRPYAENCIRETCGNELECNIEEVKTTCEEKAKSDVDAESFIADCSTKCLAGENTWVEPERQEHKEEKFVFTAGGACRQERERLDQSIWFGGWGDEFKDFHLVKQNYYSNGGADWCEREYNNLIRQRQELEKSLNEEFASWFFGDYLAGSAEEWENHISGIFDLYWRDVDLSRQMAERLECMDKTELPPHNLINFKYETDYGSIEFFEEIKTAKLSDDSQEVELISPYMKTWLFPSRDFYKFEMKKAMETGRVPGPSEEEPRNTPTEEQRQRLIEDGILDEIRAFNQNFGENLVIQFKDYSTNEVVFNIYAKVNEENLLYFEPMLPSEAPADSVLVEYDVEKLLDIVEYGEIGRVELESPPWDPQPRTGFVDNVVDGVKMYFMFREMLSSAVTTPEDAEPFATQFTRLFFESVMGGDENREKGPEFDEENQEEDGDIEQRDPITGNIIQ